MTTNTHILTQLEEFGIRGVGNVIYNPTTPHLVEEAIRREEGYLTAGGPFAALTGQHTGRSPNDKFVVKEPSSQDKVWWGTVNKEFPQEMFDALLERAKEFLSGKDLFVSDCYVGADPRYRLGVRVINMHAWHNLFAQTMFLPLRKVGASEE